MHENKIGVNMTSLLEMRMRRGWLEIALYQPADSLPDTKGPLSKKLTSSTIREANEAVRSAATKQSAKREETTLSSYLNNRPK